MDSGSPPTWRSLRISGPFFNWFVVGAYFPKAFRVKAEQESQIFSTWSMIMIKDALERLVRGSKLTPFLLGSTRRC